MGRLLRRRHIRDGLHQLPQALVPPGGGSHHRHAQKAGKLRSIHLDPLAPRLVHQIDAHNGARGDLQRLEHQIQVALQAGGITDHHRAVGTAKAEEVPGHLFLGGMGHKGIGPRQIHQNIVPAPVGMPPLRVGHRLSRPIPGVLTEVGQRIEYRGLAHVGIPRQGDDPILWAASVDDQSGVGSPRAGGGMCKAHQASTARPTAWGTFSRSSATQRASCSRNAMTAPRIR